MVDGEMHKAKDEVARELTKEVKDMFGEENEGSELAAVLTLGCTMCAIYTAYRVWWEVIDVVQVVAAQAVGRGLWQEGYQHQTLGR